MFSNTIKAALEREIIGQPRAINNVVRGVTLVVSGMTPRERMLCAYLFLGPNNMGKTQLARAVARTLHGGERHMAIVDCTCLAHADPWTAFVTQLAPIFRMPSMDQEPATLEAPPLSVILVDYLERGTMDVFSALAAALETGYVMLPQGRRGSLRNCLFFLSTSLCASEILDEAPSIGFSGSPGIDEEEDAEQERIHKLCMEQAEKQFGNDLMGQIDSIVIFHPLRQEHLSEILDRRILRLGEWMALRGFRCELLPAARGFLLERGSRDLRTGARDLVRAHRQFVEFPLADLMISGQIPAGGVVLVNRRRQEGHLHFTVQEQPAIDSDAALPLEVPISWGERAAAR